MNIYEYKRGVRALGELSIDDEAVVISRMTKTGQIVTTNIGDAKARKKIYETLKVIPVETAGIISTNNTKAQ